VYSVITKTSTAKITKNSQQHRIPNRELGYWSVTHKDNGVTTSYATALRQNVPDVFSITLGGNITGISTKTTSHMTFSLS